MWKSVLAGVILENIETLKYYQSVKAENDKFVDEILEYVSSVIVNLPWYFGLPVRMLANLIAILCLLCTGSQLNKLSSEKRSTFLRRIHFVPAFDMLNKLVRSMAFLKLFESFPVTGDAVSD